MALSRNEAGYIMFGAGLFVAWISAHGAIGNLQDNGPLCSISQSLPACSAGRRLVVEWSALGAGGVATLVIGAYLALQGRKKDPVVGRT